MPIRPENRARYPKDWKDISHRIRFGRAAARCECVGECGLDHGERCAAQHGKPHPTTGSNVVLTTAHLAEPIENCSDDNLRAMCQQCHNRYDAPMRRAGIRERAFAGQTVLPLTPPSLSDNEGTPYPITGEPNLGRTATLAGVSPSHLAPASDNFEASPPAVPGVGGGGLNHFAVQQHGGAE